MLTVRYCAVSVRGFLHQQIVWLEQSKNEGGRKGREAFPKGLLPLTCSAGPRFRRDATNSGAVLIVEARPDMLPDLLDMLKIF